MPIKSSGVLSSEHNKKRESKLFDYTHGVDLDSKLVESEIKVQKAWAKALERIALFSKEECDQVLQCLEQVRQLMNNGEFQWSIEDEDIHMNIERFLTENLGALGKKLHTGRSRNDLIATTLRLHLASCQERTIKDIQTLTQTLVSKASEWIDVIIPGMTHLQHGQPLRLSHVILAHAQGFKRDLELLKFTHSQTLAHMPLGSGALAGTSLPLDLAALAKDLSFSAPPANSYDSVGDRDFILDTLSSYSKIAIHLSRLCQDIIFWTSTGINLMNLPPEWSTGSSLMPNKRNPDVAELTRAKTAHIASSFNNALMLIKALPSSYASDLHELKRVYLFADEQLQACFKIFPHFVNGLTVNATQANRLLNSGHILATEIADDLVSRGTPFRDSYKQVAALVEKAQKESKQVHDCYTDTKIDFEMAVEKRSNAGGTAREQVLKQIAQLKTIFS